MNHRAWTVAAILLLTACADREPPTSTSAPGEPDADLPAGGTPSAIAGRTLLASLVVSNPGFASEAVAAVRAATQDSRSVAYVSLPPGTVPAGLSATLGNVRSTERRTTQLIDGGFDPVAIGAVEGDTLTVDVEVLGRPLPLRYYAVAPGRRRPRVVRTQPPPGKLDVPLTMALIVVFSEPMDPATLSPQSIGLYDGPAQVPGVTVFADAANLTVTFTPAAPLAPSHSYELRISEMARDLDGDALEGSVAVEFVTSPAGMPAALLEGRLAFSLWDSGTQTASIYTMKPDGSERRRVLDGGGDPHWSPDGTRLVFARWNGSRHDIYTSAADGTNLRLVRQNGYHPEWSPDGQRIVFGCGGVCVMNADGSGVTAVTPNQLPVIQRDVCIQDSDPTWSPDGTTIAYTRWPGPEQVWPMVYPDGVRCLSLGASRSFPYDFWVSVRLVGVDGSNDRPLPGQMAQLPYAAWPAWSPDGTRLAVSTLIPRLGVYSFDQAIAVGRVDGVGPVTYAKTSPGLLSMYGGPDWSPDGTRIVIGVGRELHFPATDGSGNVFVSPLAPFDLHWQLFWSWSRR